MSSRVNLIAPEQAYRTGTAAEEPIALSVSD